MVHAVLTKPAPGVRADGLVTLELRVDGRPVGPEHSYPDYLEYVTQTTTVSPLLAMQFQRFVASIDEGDVRVQRRAGVQQLLRDARRPPGSWPRLQPRRRTCRLHSLPSSATASGEPSSAGMSTLSADRSCSTATPPPSSAWRRRSFTAPGSARWANSGFRCSPITTFMAPVPNTADRADVPPAGDRTARSGRFAVRGPSPSSPRSPRACKPRLPRRINIVRLGSCHIR